MRKILLFTAMVAVMSVASMSTADSAYWYRHKMAGVSSTEASANAHPVISGAATLLEVEVGQVLAPFASTLIEDPDDDLVTATVTVDEPAQVTFQATGGFHDNGAGVLVFNGNSSETTAAVQGLVVAPTEGVLEPGNSAEIVLTLLVVDLAGASASASTTVTVTEPEEEPEGNLWVWGRNYNGRLGTGADLEYREPTLLASASDWSRVWSGSVGSSIGRRSDGTTFVWGANSDMQLGLGDTSHRLLPTLNPHSHWIKVTIGNTHMIALRADGTLWSWGRDTFSHGILGSGGTSPRPTPEQIGSHTDWVDVSGDESGTMALKANGTLWTWGQNLAGDLGVGHTDPVHAPEQVGGDSDWKSISHVHRFTIAIKSDGSLWTWGINTHGRRGEGTSNYSIQPTPQRLGSSTDWSFIEAGSESVFAIKSDGSLWAWGRNGNGLLGLGDTTPRMVPTRVGADTDWAMVSAPRTFALALKTDGSLWSWGANSNGQLGHGDIVERWTPTQVGTDAGWKTIAAGNLASFAIR